MNNAKGFYLILLMSEDKRGYIRANKCDETSHTNPWATHVYDLINERYIDNSLDKLYGFGPRLKIRQALHSHHLIKNRSQDVLDCLSPGQEQKSGCIGLPD